MAVTLLVEEDEDTESTETVREQWTDRLRIHLQIWVVCVVLFAAVLLLIQLPWADRFDLRAHRDYLAWLGASARGVLAPIAAAGFANTAQASFAVALGLLTIALTAWFLIRNRPWSGAFLLLAVGGSASIALILRTLIPRPVPVSHLASATIGTLPSLQVAVGIALAAAAAYLISRLVRDYWRFVIIGLGAVMGSLIVVVALTVQLPSEVIIAAASTLIWLAVLEPPAYALLRREDSFSRLGFDLRLPQNVLPGLRQVYASFASGSGKFGAGAVALIRRPLSTLRLATVGIFPGMGRGLAAVMVALGAATASVFRWRPNLRRPGWIRQPHMSKPGWIHRPRLSKPAWIRRPHMSRPGFVHRPHVAKPAWLKPIHLSRPRRQARPKAVVASPITVGEKRSVFAGLVLAMSKLNPARSRPKAVGLVTAAKPKRRSTTLHMPSMKRASRPKPVVGRKSSVAATSSAVIAEPSPTPKAKTAKPARKQKKGSEPSKIEKQGRKRDRRGFFGRKSKGVPSIPLNVPMPAKPSLLQPQLAKDVVPVAVAASVVAAGESKPVAEKVILGPATSEAVSVGPEAVATTDEAVLVASVSTVTEPVSTPAESVQGPDEPVEAPAESVQAVVGKPSKSDPLRRFRKKAVEPTPEEMEQMEQRLSSWTQRRNISSKRGKKPGKEEVTPQPIEAAH